METFDFLPFTTPQDSYAKINFFSQDPFTLPEGLSLDPFDFLDSQEEALTKDTNTPKEFTRFEEEPIMSLGVIEKKIQKQRKRQKRDKLDMVPMPLTDSRGRRLVKKPVNEYEALREEEEEKLAKKRVKRKQQKIKETLVNAAIVPINIENVNYINKPEESYKWRNWFSYYNQELNTLSSDEFFIFLKTIYEKHPQHITFENGCAEIIMKAPQDSSTSETGSINKSNQMAKQNATYQLFCGYIDQVKKQRGHVKSLI